LQTCETTDSESSWFWERRRGGTFAKFLNDQLLQYGEKKAGTFVGLEVFLETKEVGGGESLITGQGKKDWVGEKLGEGNTVNKREQRSREFQVP